MGILRHMVTCFRFASINDLKRQREILNSVENLNFHAYPFYIQCMMEFDQHSSTPTNSVEILYFTLLPYNGIFYCDSGKFMLGCFYSLIVGCKRILYSLTHQQTKYSCGWSVWPGDRKVPGSMPIKWCPVLLLFL